MKRSLQLVVFTAFMVVSFTQGNAQSVKSQSGDYPIQPVLFTAVKFTDNFWAPRIKTNHEITIPFTLGKCESTGRLKNFEIAAGLKTGEFCTEYTFDDTDVYKIIEGASYSLQIFKDPALENKVDSLIELIGKAQEPDGYIFTNRTIMGANAHEWAGNKRWEKEEILSHELYNIGHLIEAGIAHYHATGKKSLLNIAIKAADLVCEDFGPEKLHVYSGHQIIELAMAKLYRITGEQKYLDVGKFILDVRGPGGDEYNQAHKKVIDQHEAVGHAVRAAYMYAGMADIAALTGDAQYKKAIDDIWEDAVFRKIYVTGGIGATGNGEAFGGAYELPNMSAYNETCASIANVYWNYRQFLLHGDAKYFDVLERTLYNAFLSGVSITGDRFFYPNPLESHGQHERSPWFSCACCPGNVTRFVPSVGGYFYAQKANAIYVNLYGANKAEFSVNNSKITLDQKTDFPWEGNIRITVSSDKATDASIHLRIPGWSVDDPIPGDLYSFKETSKTKPKVLLNGKEINYNTDKGYAVIKRKWQTADVIQLILPMETKRIVGHGKIEADKGRFTYQRGPIVYCAEWPDYKSRKVLNLVMPENAKIDAVFDNDFFGGMYLLKSQGLAAATAQDGSVTTTNVPVTLIPYFSWAHRGAGEMMVWIPNELSAAKPMPPKTIASSSTVTASYERLTLKALQDQVIPKSSSDRSIMYYHWWPKKDTVQWVQYDFEKTESVSSAKVYWYDDGPFGGCRIPAGWKLLYRKDDQWVPVKTISSYQTKKDDFSTVTFESVNTKALRLEIQLPKEHSSGILEWSVLN